MKTARVLSFPGFYHSELSAELDMAEEHMVESINDEHNVDAAPHIYDCSDYEVGFNYVAEAYAEMLGFEFDRMESPREYNFTTDRLYVKVDPQDLFDRMDPEVFDQVLKDYFTDRPGFISFYRGDAAAWLRKPLELWDENELGALLESTLEERTELAYEVYSNAVDAQTNFARLSELLGVNV